MPCRGYDENKVWLELSLTAADLLTWAQTLCFTGETARMNHASSAMPGGLSFKIQPSRRFRWLNPDAILSVRPGSEPRIQRRGWIEGDRTDVLGSNPTGSRPIVLRQISTGPVALDSIHQDRIAWR